MAARNGREAEQGSERTESPEEQQSARRTDAEQAVAPRNVIELGPMTTLTLDGLTEEQVQELTKQQAEGMIQVQIRAADIAIDAKALDVSLGTLSKHTEEVAQSGQSVTITQTRDDKLGRTEIIMGTSDAAKRGKLTHSQIGGRDYTPIWIVVGLIVFVMLVIAVIAIAD